MSDPDAQPLAEPPPDLQAFYWYPPIIAATCRGYRACVYIEVGVGRGFAIQQIAPACAEVHAVDTRPPDSVQLPRDTRFWNIPSDEFFRVYDGSTPHVVFVDGDHSYVQAKRDFENALELLAVGGQIFLHDTWPRNQDDATSDYCGEVWMLADEIASSPQLESFTWTRFPGLTIVRRRGEGVAPEHLRERDL